MRYPGRCSRDRSRGLTGLELLVIIAIVTGGVALGLFWESTRERAPPSGIIPFSLATAERSLVVAGEVYGYWARDGKAGGLPVGFPGEPWPGIDAVSVPVQLVVGKEPLDMDTVGVAVRSGSGGAVILGRDKSGLPGRSSWAVTGKTGVIPLQDADRDDLLEEPETFRILVVPPGPLAPGGHVTITITTVPGLPLVIERDIPRAVSPVTLLSF